MSNTPLQTHLTSWAYSHVQSETSEAAADWLRGATVAGWPLPLGVAHDLGSLLSGCQARVATPRYLEAVDTGSYLLMLERVARHPLVQTIAGWGISETLTALLVAKLIEGAAFPVEYTIETGEVGIRLQQLLAQRMTETTPEQVWQALLVAKQLVWSTICTPDCLAQIERNLNQLKREEVLFLHQYGTPLWGSPDPRDLLDLLNLTGLPAAVLAVMSQTLKLLPRLSESKMLGGMQLYPEGGFAGLARKGSLDNLLPTELAYDEAYFVHRIVNHEALYYGRERQKDKQRELAYVVMQTGFGLGGDGDVLCRAVTLALGQLLKQRGYEVQVSIAAGELSVPFVLDKPSGVTKVLYTRERGMLQSKTILPAILQQLRRWQSTYRQQHVFWVVGERFDAEGLQGHRKQYQGLRALAGQQVWYVSTPRKRGKHTNGHHRPPETAQQFEAWQRIDSNLLRPDGLPTLQALPPQMDEQPAWWALRDVIEGQPFRDGVHDVLHFTTAEQRTAWDNLAEIENEPTIDDYLCELAPPEMIYIPPSTFLMGSAEDDPEAQDNEKPQHELWLAGYYIDRYPVTNAQYRDFIAAGGYGKQECWTEVGWQEKESNGWIEPRYWQDSRFNAARQPVVGISWYESVAYALWAGKGLPTEPHWEKAASWDPVTHTKRRYPWGNEWDAEKCNCMQRHDGTTEVGAYSTDVSVYGMEDVAGNVYEHLQTKWEDDASISYRFPYDPLDGREHLEGSVTRVNKSAGWNDDQGNAKKYGRCGFRDGYNPRFRNGNHGFRCQWPHAFSYSPSGS
ncbi:MAG: SUMF1/EgtB/PvdO family nonheme iron enzyme [Candidatus Promineifilaceae bacterium]